MRRMGNDGPRSLVSVEKMKIVRAQAAEADVLSRIAFAAKRHWGYPEAWMQRWQDALTITVEYVQRNPTFVGLIEGEAAGFCALLMEGEEAWLDHLWVMPWRMRRGVGRALFAHAEKFAKANGVRRLKIVGDPHAEPFYRRMGAVCYGSQAADIEGVARRLPLFEKVFTNTSGEVGA